MAKFDGTFATHGPQSPKAWVIVQQALETDSDGNTRVADAPPLRYDKSYRSPMQAAMKLRELLSEDDTHTHMVPATELAGDDRHYSPVTVLQFPPFDHDIDNAVPILAVLIYQQGYNYDDLLDRMRQRAEDRQAIHDLEAQFSSTN